MNLPLKYKWLDTIGVLPKLVTAALQYLGIREIPGKQSNPVIMDMAKGLGIANIYTNDDTAWCGLFMSHLFRITGKPELDYGIDKFQILIANAYKSWGKPVSKEDMRLGDVVILERPGGGHVFILLGISPTGNPIGIGGNQGNSVSIAEFDKDRIVGVRRYYSQSMPASAKTYKINSEGGISTNEA